MVTWIFKGDSRNSSRVKSDSKRIQRIFRKGQAGEFARNSRRIHPKGGSNGIQKGSKRIQGEVKGGIKDDSRKIQGGPKKDTRRIQELHIWIREGFKDGLKRVVGGIQKKSKEESTKKDPNIT